MEKMASYLHRKYEELQLLDDCLDRSSAPAMPKSIEEVIELKFKLTAAIKAQHVLADWSTTETDWSHRKKHRGAFNFKYDYQRADLEVSGPSFYDLEDDFLCETIYTASGMTSISTLLIGVSHVLGRVDMVVLRRTYGETLEFVEEYAGQMNLIEASNCSSAPASRALPVVLLLDACAPAKDFENCLRWPWNQFSLCIFDTSCLAGGSGKIIRALRKARSERVPVVMVRSHTKLDSLGVEYGRLGSTTFVRSTIEDFWTSTPLAALPDEARKAIRLFGGAAHPAHFPPYVGSSKYRSLTCRRVAAIVRNHRRASHMLRKSLGNLAGEMNLAHSLYVLLRPGRQLDEETARKVASEMSGDLSKKGLVIRHAGSFGFDFAAIEWFQDSSRGEFNIRVAIPDLPTEIWDTQSEAIAAWWREHN